MPGAGNAVEVVGLHQPVAPPRAAAEADQLGKPLTRRRGQVDPHHAVGPAGEEGLAGVAAMIGFLITAPVTLRRGLRARWQWLVAAGLLTSGWWSIRLTARGAWASSSVWHLRARGKALGGSLPSLPRRMAPAPVACQTVSYVVAKA